MAKIQILVADDHELFRKGLETLIGENIDFNVTVGVKNRTELFQRLSEEQIDVVLLDISFPDESGLDILKELKARYPQIKCVMLTMHEEGRYIRESLSKGADGYLLKETGTDELFEAIYAVSRGRKHFKNKISEKLVESMSNSESDQILTDREREIVRMVADGKITKEIAEQLFISVRTVETHRSKIMKKLNVANASEMIRTALARKLI